MSARDTRLDAIQARLDAATPGPWVADELGDVETVPDFDLHRFDIMPETIARTELRKEDGEFIANAPADVSFLLTELRKAHEALERVEALTTQLLNESKGNRNTANELRKGERTYRNREDIRAHEQASVIGHNHANRIRAAVAAAKGDEE